MSEFDYTKDGEPIRRQPHSPCSWEKLGTPKFDKAPTNHPSTQGLDDIDKLRPAITFDQKLRTGPYRVRRSRKDTESKRRAKILREKGVDAYLAEKEARKGGKTSPKKKPETKKTKKRKKKKIPPPVHIISYVPRSEHMREQREQYRQMLRSPKVGADSDDEVEELSPARGGLIPIEERSGFGVDPTPRQTPPGSPKAQLQSRPGSPLSHPTSARSPAGSQPTSARSPKGSRPGSPLEMEDQEDELELTTNSQTHLKSPVGYRQLVADKNNADKLALSEKLAAEAQKVADEQSAANRKAKLARKKAEVKIKAELGKKGQDEVLMKDKGGVAMKAAGKLKGLLKSKIVQAEADEEDSDAEEEAALHAAVMAAAEEQKKLAEGDLDMDKWGGEGAEDGPWDRVRLNMTRLDGMRHWWSKHIRNVTPIVFEKSDPCYECVVKDFQISQRDLRRLKKKFQHVDITGEGAIDKSEFLEMCEDRALSNSNLNTTYVSRLFDRLDEDKNDELSFKEFVNVICFYSSMSKHEIVKFCFDCFDVSGDGQLDEREFIEVVQALQGAEPAFPGNFNDALEKFDVNDDGRIDFFEFRTMCNLYPMLFFPAFSLQDRIQRKSLGYNKWIRYFKRRQQREKLVEYRRLHGTLPNLTLAERMEYLYTGLNPHEKILGRLFHKFKYLDDNELGYSQRKDQADIRR